jgi:hypothetical protein
MKKILKNNCNYSSKQALKQKINKKNYNSKQSLKRKD